MAGNEAIVRCARGDSGSVESFLRKPIDSACVLGRAPGGGRGPRYRGFASIFPSSGRFSHSRSNSFKRWLLM